MPKNVLRGVFMNRAKRLWTEARAPKESSRESIVNQSCQSCNSTVSRDFVRVFARKNADGVAKCPDCATRIEIKEVR